MVSNKSNRKFWEPIVYSLPVQLLLNHLKRNHLLLFCWFILFLIITGNFGRYLGIPFLFLDPEYLFEVSFYSFFIMGFVVAGFTIAFHITTYITDGARFPFLGTLPKPFTHFILNNSIIPFIFLVVYILEIIEFQTHHEFASTTRVAWYLTGLLLGYLVMLVFMFVYFRFTNKDIFKYVANTFDEKLKKKIRITRSRVMEKVKLARKSDVRVDSFLNVKFRFSKVSKNHGYNSDEITKVFDQNHLNLVIIEFLIFFLLLIMGVFREYAAFQLPAAASLILFVTIIIMFIGAFAYWFGSWAVTISLALLIFINVLVKQEVMSSKYKAFGLNYDIEQADYNIARIRALNTKKIIADDKNETTKILNNWKSKFQNGSKPKAIFVCTSGGGQRASLWTLKVLQEADKLTNGGFFDHTILITGASGGIIGASYFRELDLRKNQGEAINPQNPQYLEDISRDNLNPIIFSFLVNDLFVKFQNFNYAGIGYSKDRGYSFEEQINRNTRQMLDKPLMDYLEPEFSATIPMLIMGPTIINDGRKLFISPQNVSYMNIFSDREDENNIPDGIDFKRFYENQGSQNLRFLSALRMNATFPYITPNITLPSSPPMEIMDAGISDNFGIADALRFIYVFQDWLEQNTSGVIIVSIRDSKRDTPVKSLESKSLIKKFSKPISSIYINFENLQEISNNNKITFAKDWYKGDFHRFDFQYIPQSFSENLDDVERASLSWRLTTREKEDIKRSMDHPTNKNALQSLNALLRNSASQISIDKISE